MAQGDSLEIIRRRLQTERGEVFGSSVLERGRGVGSFFLKNKAKGLYIIGFSDDFREVVEL